MTSLSTRFLGQPRLTKPTLTGAAGSEVADMIFFAGTGTIDNNDQRETELSNSSTRHCPTGTRRTPEPEHQGGYSSFPPIRVARANLMEIKTAALNAPEERCRLNVSRY